MKKILLSAVALVAAMSVNAQEFCSFNEENTDFAALGLTTEAAAQKGGTVIGKTTSITAAIGADDNYKTVGCNGVNCGETLIKGGLQGAGNPKDADGGTPSSTLIAPVSGAYLEFAATDDGWLYVIHKASSNKAYTVFEEGQAIGYTFAAIGDASTDLGAVYGYTIKGGGEYNYLKDGGVTSVEWPEQIYTRAKGTYDSHLDGEGKWQNIAKSGMGVLKFQVFKGCKYAVNANGSKITCSGFIFDKDGKATLTTKVDENDVTFLENGEVPASAAGISNIKAEKVNGVVYNIAGQKITASYKGIAIQNGKKVVLK